eukprot:TRINITY_DN1051_c0_g1_i1.p1 TRINITY_DN1051_c0_g1~~TRINITY_DN1051_c0_g1_i1.p1  ORF type:complete len:323 (-),score=81.51 TRINITY_DN1051_c0_g1_i1:303-1271(-)
MGGVKANGGIEMDHKAGAEAFNEAIKAGAAGIESGSSSLHQASTAAVDGFGSQLQAGAEAVVAGAKIVQAGVAGLGSITPPLPASGCNCPQSNYEPCRGGDGICASASECEGMGGESIGKCSNCLGCSVCCRFTSGCQGMTNKMITYFQSPAYPRTDRSNEVCSLTVTVKEEVCQVRLDFIDFEMAAPLCGDCSLVDNLEIINTAQPGGVLGPGQSRLCGLNSGQHLYLPVTPNNMLILKATTSGVRNVPLAATDGRNRGLSGDTAFRWNVRVTQIPCRPNEGVVGGGADKTVDVSTGAGIVTVSGAVGFDGRNGACKCKNT